MNSCGCLGDKDTASAQKIFLSFIFNKVIMKRIFLAIVCMAYLLSSCKLMNKKQAEGTSDKMFAQFLDNYYEQNLKLSPLTATENGDNRYNDLLPIDMTEGYNETVKSFLKSYLDSLSQFSRKNMNENDKISYDILKRELEMNIERINNFHENYMPFNQFGGLPLTMGELGSGDGAQPFNTTKNYEDWIKRATAFSAWTDSAIVYFKKGIDSNIVLPHSLVVKIIPQMEDMVTDDVEKSIFWG